MQNNKKDFRLRQLLSRIPYFVLHHELIIPYILLIMHYIQEVTALMRLNLRN
jgi:hypothetical protein